MTIVCYFHNSIVIYSYRDQLVVQLEKSQDMLVNFQQELTASEQELQRQRQENQRLKEGGRSPQPSSHESQRLQAEIQALKQKLQETAARGDTEMEQWRKVVEQEKNRADQAEKNVGELHKKIQVI